MLASIRKGRRLKNRRPSCKKHGFFQTFQLHPLFVCVGVWYCFKGELFLFLLSALVAVQHECAHAFAAARLGYKLNKIVLMPFGAVIDGDIKDISFKDELYVAACGPICNLLTAAFFVALWWMHPTAYAFTDTACYSSLSIALVNLIPAYPLDGGRILKCALAKMFLRTQTQEKKSEEKAEKICKGITLGFAFAFLLAFGAQALQKSPNFTLLAFSVFLLFGGLGNAEKTTYSRMDFSYRQALKKGVEIRRIAVLESLPVKDAFRFLAKGYYLVLEVYDEQENHLFDVSQNQLSAMFMKTQTPYVTIGKLCKNADF